MAQEKQEKQKGVQPQTLSSVKIWKTVRNPDNVTLTDAGVEVHNHSIKVCEKLARKIFKEDL